MINKENFLNLKKEIISGEDLGIWPVTGFRTWKTIDSAPKDGTQILVYNKKHKQMSVVKWDLERWALLDAEDVYEYSYHFDYWDHLPLPPESEGV